MLGTFSRSGPLAPDSSYQAEQILRLPNGISGHHYVFVKTDCNNQVFEHQFEDNNIRVSDHTIDIELAPWPDLQVVQVTTVATASAGERITVQWQVMNIGSAPTSATVWQDRIYLAPDSLWNRANAVHLAETYVSLVLDSAESYQQTQQVTLPANLSGTYYIYLVTDANNNVYEHTGEDNNIRRSDPLQIQAYPPVDLAVIAISGPDSVLSGQVITVQWTVQNLGDARTLVSDWHDGMYLSGDSLLNRNQAVLLKRVRHSASLAAKASYTQTEQVQLPNGISGEFFLYVITDLENRVADSDPANNFRRMEHPLFIQATELPDLAAIALAGPSESQSGQPVIVRWSGQNTGTGSILRQAWQDAIFLSADSRLDANDQRLGSKSRSSPLLAQEVYHDSLEIEIPVHAVGAYYLILKCDSGDDIYEAAEDNNTRAYLINMSLAQPSDLVVSSITVPQSAIPGEDVTVSWTLQNIGENAAKGWLYDAVFISGDTIWQVSDPMLGVLRHSIDLAPGKSQLARLTVNLSRSYLLDAEGNITQTLPGVLPGSYYILVRTNIRASIRERDYGNNMLASTETVAVTVPLLQPGIARELTLAQNRMKFYGVNVDANLNLRIKVTGDVPAAINEVYIALNRMPTLTDYDYCQSEPQTADPLVLVPTTRAGTYYILVYARKLPANQANENLTILVEVLPFSVFAIAPNRGGHGGRITCRITGAGFEAPMQVFLQNHQGQQYDGEILDLVNSTELKIRWDLENVPLGSYDLVVKKPDEQNEILPGAFTVEPLQNDQIYTDVQGPEALPGGRNAVYEIYVTNNNNVDADYIILTIAVPAYQHFELKTNDFFGRPIPEEYMSLMEYPMAGQRFGDIAFLVCMARDVPVGGTLHATLVLYNISGRAHSFMPFFIKAYALSQEEFILRELLLLTLIREQILSTDSKSSEEIRNLLTPDESLRDYWTALNQTGIVGDGNRTMPTIPLRYDPSHASSEPMTPFIDCEKFGEAAKFVAGYFVSIASIAADVGDLAVIAAISGTVPPVGMALLAVKIGFFWYDAVQYECRQYSECPDWVTDPNSNVNKFKELTSWMIALTGGFGGVARKLLTEVAKWAADNAASFFCEELIYANDPNEIIGPTGFGPEKWITRSQQLGYRINFENDSTLATAPAQMVLITQQLDSNVDARAFRLGKFGFGNFTFEIPENRSFFTQRLDVRDSLNLFVDINFGIDVTTNQAFWRFQSIDPGTGQSPVNPYSGFLLVNDRWHRGQGFVHYTVRPKSTARTRDTIQAMADIVFDNNDPIATPEIFNTIDAGAPTSRVNPLPAQIDTAVFTVSWSGQDDANGSGIRNYTLYLAEDDQPFRPFQAHVADTFLVFAGELGHFYQFFTIATDNAGNTEPMKTAAEASVITRIKDDDPGKIPTEFALYQNYPNPFNASTTIKYDLPRATRVEVLVYNILGQKVKSLVDEKQEAGKYQIDWNGTNNSGVQVASGLYLYLIRTREFKQVKKMILIK